MSDLQKLNARLQKLEKFESQRAAGQPSERHEAMLEATPLSQWRRSVPSMELVQHNFTAPSYPMDTITTTPRHCKDDMRLLVEVSIGDTFSVTNYADTQYVVVIKPHDTLCVAKSPPDHQCIFRRNMQTLVILCVSPIRGDTESVGIVCFGPHQKIWRGKRAMRAPSETSEPD